MGKPGVTQAHTAAVVGTGAALPHQDGALGVVGGDQAGAAQLPLLQGGRFGVAGVLKAPGQGTLAAGVDKGPLVGLPRPPYHHQVVDQAGPATSARVTRLSTKKKTSARTAAAR